MPEASLSVDPGRLAPAPSEFFAGQTREQFAASQESMTQTWYENLVRSGRDVEAYIATRKAAYLSRWREAGRYFGEGGRVLDIGGGNIYPELLAYIGSMGWDYWYCDVGESETRAAADLAAGLGFNPAQFSRRLNHELDYDEAAFDAVFSSHCIEHSMNLPLTLRQLHRILKPGATLAISIPIGWDTQPNHPYFLAENEWIALLEDAGFFIRAFQLSSEYGEHKNEDLMIAAERTGPVADRFRLDVTRYTKTNYRFRGFADPAAKLRGQIDECDNYAILRNDWRIEISLEAGISEVLPVFSRHSWSGVVCVRSGADAGYYDLFRPRASHQPVRLTLTAPSHEGQIVTIAPVARNDLSRDAQGVFVGFLTR